MKILVTGGAGFIGFHVAAGLLKRGDDVIIVDNFNDYYDAQLKKDRIAELKKYKNMTVYKADISDAKALEQVFKRHQFDKICHLAAQAGVRYSLTEPKRYELWNNLGTLNVFECARKFNVKDVVFASSSSVYGANTKVPFSETDAVDHPISFYAATKKSNELYAYAYHNLYGLNCTGLRFFTVYGPWGRPDMAYFKFAESIMQHKPIDVYNNGKMKRDFTYISDIVAGVLAAIDKPFPYEIINLGNNRPVELMRFITILENEIGRTAKKNMLPMQQGDMPVTYADIRKAKRLLNYSPKVNIEEGLGRFIEWFKRYYHE